MEHRSMCKVHRVLGGSAGVGADLGHQVVDSEVTEVQQADVAGQAVPSAMPLDVALRLGGTDDVLLATAATSPACGCFLDVP